MATSAYPSQAKLHQIDARLSELAKQKRILEAKIQDREKKERRKRQFEVGRLVDKVGLLEVDRGTFEHALRALAVLLQDDVALSEWLAKWDGESL